MNAAPIKIMYLMDYYYDINGGTEGQLFELIKGLDGKLFEPHLFVFRPTDFVTKKKNSFPCPITILNVGKLATIDTILKLIKLSHFIKKENFKIVHIFFKDAALIAPLFCKMGGACVVSSRRDMGFWYTSSSIKVLQISNLFVDRIIANSKAVKENVLQKEGPSEKKVLVIYNGHDEQRFKAPPLSGFRESLGIGPDDPIIGMVANLYPIKRQADLLKAFVYIRERFKNAHIVFVGEGKDESYPSLLKKIAVDLRVDQNTHFVGRILDVIPVIKHFTIGVLCSESEGLSNSILECMGCGIPVVCTNVGGNPEIIKDGVNGFLTSVGDVYQLADKISKILSDRSLAALMSQKAIQTAEKFTVKNMIDSHTDLYLQLLSQNNSGENVADTSYYR